MPPEPSPAPRSRRLLLAGAGAVVLAVVVAVVLVVTLRSSDGGTSASTSGQAAAGTTAKAVPALASRSDLRPPTPDIRRSAAGQAPGLIFVAPKKVFGAPKRAGEQNGPLIMDSRGRVRWFLPIPAPEVAYDFREQTYRGKPVLTYWQGRALAGSGKGTCVIRDTSYELVKRVRFDGPNKADIHECKLTDRGTMLMLAYEQVPGDERSVGGAKAGTITEGVVKEIDVATNRVLLEWRSLDGVPLKDSYEDLGGHSGPGYDYIHLNSVDVDTDGNLLVSARHTWAIYKINRSSGKLMWKLGGKDSDFKMGKGAQTAWQHDAINAGDGVIRTFDNAAGTSGNVRTYPYSRITWVKVDEGRRTATLQKSLRHPGANLSAGTQGNSQALADGHLFVGWGSQGVFSEFTAGGKLLFDARVPRGYDTYRAYRDEWTGAPKTKPSVAARRSGSATVVDASWNGATAVQRWQVVGGSSRSSLAPVGDAARWSGLDTAVRVPGSPAYVAVRALGSAGKVLSTSATVRVR